MKRKKKNMGPNKSDARKIFYKKASAKQFDSVKNYGKAWSSKKFDVTVSLTCTAP